MAIYQKSENLKFIPNSKLEWTKEKLLAKYDKVNEGSKNGYGIFAVKNSVGDIIGEAGLFNSFLDEKHLEVGYIIDEKFWKQGFGFEVCKSLINYGFQKLKIRKLTARMFAENVGSIRISEKCNMVFIREGLTEKGERYYEYAIENNMLITK